MDRRTVLKGAGAAAGIGAGATALAAPAYAKGKRTLKMVTTWPKGLPGLGTLAQNTADRITETTEGQITVKVFAAGELSPAFESFDSVSTGAADMYHGAEYYWQGKSQGFNFFTSVPFGLNVAEHLAWIYHGGGQELWDELAAPFKVKPFVAGSTGVQMGGWFNREINTLEDLKGLKVRMPGLGGEVLRRLGAAAVALPGGEIFQSLQTGQIDGTEWVGPWNDRALGFYRVAKYYYWPGFHEPGTVLSLGINKGIWDSFTPNQQNIVRTVCEAETSVNLAEYNWKNAGYLEDLVQKHGVQLKRFSDEILKEIGRVSAEVVKEAGQESDLSKRIYESYLEAQRIGIAWGKISEEGFAYARRLSYGDGN